MYPVAACSPDRIQAAIHAHWETLAGASIASITPKRPSVETRDVSHRPSKAANSKIAIVGVSGRFPQAGSMDAFWDVLSRGIDTHEMVNTPTLDIHAVLCYSR